jgi:hypothetical protein
MWAMEEHVRRSVGECGSKLILWSVYRAGSEGGGGLPFIIVNLPVVIRVIVIHDPYFLVTHRTSAIAEPCFPSDTQQCLRISNLVGRYKAQRLYIWNAETGLVGGEKLRWVETYGVLNRKCQREQCTHQ